MFFGTHFSKCGRIFQLFTLTILFSQITNAGPTMTDLFYDVQEVVTDQYIELKPVKKQRNENVGILQTQPPSGASRVPNQGDARNMTDCRPSEKEYKVAFTPDKPSDNSGSETLPSGPVDPIPGGSSPLPPIMDIPPIPGTQPIDPVSPIDPLPPYLPPYDPGYGSGIGGSTGLVIADQIISIGTRLWQFVNLMKPGVTFNRQVSHALPRGVQCWMDLEEWDTPKAFIRQVNYKTIFGISMGTFTYRIVYTSGGNIEGVGKYLANTTVDFATGSSIPMATNLTATAELLSAINMGKKKSPIAGQQIIVNRLYNNPAKALPASNTFFVRGDGRIEEIK